LPFLSLRLVTERLTLRPVTAENSEVFHGILTDPFVRKYLCDDTVLSPEQTGEFISDSERTFAERGYGLWLIERIDSGEIIGFVGLRDFFDEDRPQLLYALLPEFTGNGFAAEAAARVIEFAFSKLGFDYLEASCDAPNTASHKVAERLGMKKVKEEEKDGVALVYFRLER
jgi:[ribosomal protein S5]-alanine N-acetyltransferase